MSFILEHGYTIATSVVAFAAAIAAITPNKTDDTITGALRKVVDALALNVGNAKNAKNKGA